MFIAPEVHVLRGFMVKSISTEGEGIQCLNGLRVKGQGVA